MVSETGVLLVAIERPFYGELAYNLALSLRLSDCRVPIALVTDGKALDSLSEQQCRVFDQQITVRSSHCLDDGVANPYLLKMHLFDITPFERTLYLDVDAVFFRGYRSFQTLLEELGESSFQIQEEFRFTKARAHGPNHYLWGDLPTIWSEFALSPDALFVEYNSSLIWFDRSEPNQRFFELAQSTYHEPRVPLETIGTFVPDEVAWSIASASLEYYGSRPLYQPIYVQNFSEVRRRFPELRSREEYQEIVREHYLLGLPAVPPTRSVVHFYNELVRKNALESGDSRPFLFRAEEKLVRKSLDGSVPEELIFDTASRPG
jgi:hypothetical protein